MVIRSELTPNGNKKMTDKFLGVQAQAGQIFWEMPFWRRRACRATGHAPERRTPFGTLS
jgi:hypothetical protein